MTVWANVEQSVVQVVEDYRDSFAKAQRAKDLKKRFQVLIDAHQTYLKEHHPSEVHGVTPPLGDIYLLPEVQEILFAEPLGEPIEQNDFAEVFERLPEFGKQWRKNCCKLLVEIMQPHAKVFGLNTVDESSPQLATALFVCTTTPCQQRKEVMDLERALVHSCFVNRDDRSYQCVTKDDNDLDIFTTLAYERPWMATASGSPMVSVATRAVGLTKMVIEMLGLDPKTTTRAELDALDPLFRVTNPSLYGDYAEREVYTWRGVAVCTQVFLFGHPLLTLHPVALAISSLTSTGATSITLWKKTKKCGRRCWRGLKRE